MNTHEKAIENLQIIRETMERSSALTSVSGPGVVAMGVIATIGAFIAPLGSTLDWWVYTWLTVAAVGCSTGFAATYRQSRTRGHVTTVSAFRRFGLALAPPIVAGCVLTDILFREDRFDLMPGMWMLLYGAGVITAGAFSIRLIPLMGLTFMLLGAIGLYLPDAWFDPAWGKVAPIDCYLAAAFGGVHIASGFIIGARYNA